MNEFRIPDTNERTPAQSISSFAIDRLTARGKRIRKVFRRSKKLGVRQVHRARVELRRMRASLELFAPLIQAKSITKLDRQLRKVTRLLGPVRDLDVLFEQSLTWTQHLRSEELVQFLLTLAERRRKLVQSCRNQLTSNPMRTMSKRLRRLRLVEGASEAAIKQQLRLLLSRLPVSIDFREDEIPKMHDLRKQCRQLRYQFELVKGFFTGTQVLSFLKQAQTYFGQLNDSAVILERLNETNTPFLPPSLREAIETQERELIHRRLAAAVEFWNGPNGRGTVELS